MAVTRPAPRLHAERGARPGSVPSKPHARHVDEGALVVAAARRPGFALGTARRATGRVRLARLVRLARRAADPCRRVAVAVLAGLADLAPAMKAARVGCGIETWTARITQCSAACAGGRIARRSAGAARSRRPSRGSGRAPARASARPAGAPAGAAGARKGRVGSEIPPAGSLGRFRARAADRAARDHAAARDPVRRPPIHRDASVHAPLPFVASAPRGVQCATSGELNITSPCSLPPFSLAVGALHRARGPLTKLPSSPAPSCAAREPHVIRERAVHAVRRERCPAPPNRESPRAAFPRAFRARAHPIPEPASML